MIFTAIDKRIRRAFSNAAMQYDVLASLQKEIGRELVKKIGSLDEARTVLDVGMGTGWMTDRLASLCSDGLVIGVDPALGMLDTACKKYENLCAIGADARALPFKEHTFDIVTSNLAYQWVNDLAKAFEESHRLLKPNGIFCLTMFGQETLRELFDSLEAVKGEKLFIQRLASLTDIEKALAQASFREVHLEKETIKVHFPDMLTLIKWLKDIGANILPKNGFIGKELLFEADGFYKKNFSDPLGITATFEVVWIKAKK